MSVLKILMEGDESLLKKSEPVKKLTNELKDFMVDMLETLQYYGGLGLSAPQVGRNIRVLVMDTTVYPNGTIKLMVNPRIGQVSGETSKAIEMCMSCPGKRVEVERADKIGVYYYEIGGGKRYEEFEGINARVIQHEIEHLDGILISKYDKRE